MIENNLVEIIYRNYRNLIDRKNLIEIFRQNNFGRVFKKCSKWKSLGS